MRRTATAAARPLCFSVVILRAWRVPRRVPQDDAFSLFRGLLLLRFFRGLGVGLLGRRRSLFLAARSLGGRGLGVRLGIRLVAVGLCRLFAPRLLLPRRLAVRPA